jgi:hypothetical protein
MLVKQDISSHRMENVKNVNKIVSYANLKNNVLNVIQDIFWI